MFLLFTRRSRVPCSCDPSGGVVIMPKKIRQYCDACRQVTTQVAASNDSWKCLCCESAKHRGAEATKKIQEKNRRTDRLNIGF